MNASTQTVKCLLVDDLEENLVALSSVLRRPGLELLQARSAREALELLLVHDVALALIDVQMPEMDGFELAELMRGTSRTSHIPIIFVTAGMREPYRVFQGYDLGAVDFLFKPIDPQILRNKAETFFSLQRQKQELSEQVRLREELARELESTLRFNETFVAVVGHDLRNPLNAILMGVEVLQKQAADPALAATIRQIRSSGQRMRRMLDDLSDMARARLGEGFAIHREPADLGAVARKVVAEHSVSNPDRAVQLHQKGDTVGEWDGNRVEQLLGNLVGNALRHGQPGAAVQVEVDGTRANVVEVSVHNRGHIPPDLLPHLFLPFRAGSDRRAKSEGLGLGLYIVEQLVLAHDGSVSVQSTQESGTTFRVELPRRKQQAEATATLDQAVAV